MIDFVNSITHSANATPVTVAATFTPPSGAPASGFGNWINPAVFELPEGAGLNRHEASHFFEVTIAFVPSAPRGSVVVAPEFAGGPDKTWRVESIEPSPALGKRVLILVETT